MLANFFTQNRKNFIANKLGEIGTAIIIAIVIGEFLSEHHFNYLRFITGLSIAFVCYMFASIVMPKD